MTILVLNEIGISTFSSHEEADYSPLSNQNEVGQSVNNDRPVVLLNNVGKDAQRRSDAGVSPGTAGTVGVHTTR